MVARPRSLIALLMLAACEPAVPVFGQVSYGDEAFTPVRCVDAERVFGMKHGSVAFQGEPRGGLFIVPGFGDTIIMYHSPVRPSRSSDGEIIAADSHCSTFEFGDGHLRIDCDAQPEVERAGARGSDQRLRADLRFTSCP